MRLFFAIDIPEKIKKNIFLGMKNIEELISCRPVKIENLHITLTFLGEVQGEDIHNIVKSAESQEFSSIEVSIGKIEFFYDSRGNIKIICRNVFDRENKLEKINDFLAKENKNIFEKNKVLALPFRGHITLARIKRNAGIIDVQTAEILKFLNDKIKEEKFRVDEFHLYKSTLTHSGAEYEVIKSFKLKGRV